MKLLALLLGSSILLSASAAHAGDAAIEATPRQFRDTFNKGDVAAAKALHTVSPVIIDEPAPHFWTGPEARPIN